MSKAVVAVLAIILLVAAAFVLTSSTPDTNTETSPSAMPTSTPTPSNEEAELTGFGFMLAFADEDFENAYLALSENAKSQVSEDNLEEDLYAFVGEESIPEDGVSVEDILVVDNTAVLTVGMNYRSGRLLKNVNLVVENGEWKVDSVDPLEGSL